ncbi:MAG: tRNA (N(6)-L-threonylcarbamoyladenosine(37)-C(2))-methylthiotransferase MtaB [Oscillospiraceae bacterium]|nr:tRNA (N(6)-L-threonylcarbamoyladenosine(37)-C(2))-methylthiotransferase MtaB [Oscillospiraceae bacterium]
MRAAFYTLGCKVNQYETQIMIQQFAADGYDIVEAHEDADVYVVNSCTVTSTGDKKTRQVIHRLHRQNPSAVIALTGCYSQAYPAEVSAMEEINVLTGTGNKTAILGHVNTFLKTHQRIVDIPAHDRRESFEPMKADSFLERTRAFVKIQDGCEHYCSYCIIPYARGFVRSKTLEDLKLELYNLSIAGFREVVLVGIDLSSYGKDLGLRLIDAILAACTTDGIERVRLGSLEPDLFSDEDYQLLATLPQFCPQFHLSLQSGCDATLKRMNRHYDSTRYREIVAKIRRYFDNPSITTDVMVGFAGETEEEFQQSLDFCKEIAFAKTHVFAYSIRKGTRAATMPNQVTNAVKEQRSHILSDAMEICRKDFMQKQIGLTEEVLFETDVVRGGYVGYTKNYTPVWVQSEEALCGQLRNVNITGCDEQYCLGELI